LGSEYRVTIVLDHQKLSYFTKKVLLYRRQARWAEFLKSYHFVIIYRKGSANQKADIHSRCPPYTSGVGSTTAVREKPLLGPEQWLEIEATEIEDNDYDTIDIRAVEVDQLIPEQKERIFQDANLDNQYREIWKAVGKSDNEDNNYSIKYGLLYCKGRLYAPKKTREGIRRSDHDSQVAVRFGRDRTMELIRRNVYWPNMEEDIRKFCNACDKCQRTKAPRHAKHGLLHPVQLPSEPWTHISTDFITDLPTSGGMSTILMVVDRFTKMAHFIPIDKRDSPTVAKAYLEQVWMYHGFPGDVVSDRDGTFTGRYFTDL